MKTQPIPSRQVRFGDPGSPICGAPCRTGHPCRRRPLKGEERCPVHAAPAALERWRSRQDRRFSRGSLSADVRDGANARRQRNRLQSLWRRDPRLSGRTIDLGSSEWRFREAVGGAGVDLQGLMPAVADWLRWRWQRLQNDRQDDATWLEVLRSRLPARIEDARQRAEWTDLGGFHRGHKAGKAVHAALRAAGPEAAEAVAAPLRAAGHGRPPGTLEREHRRLCVRPWRADDADASFKRKLPTPPREPRPVRRSAALAGLWTPPGPPDEDRRLLEARLLRQADPVVRQTYCALGDETERRAYLHAYRERVENPDDNLALMRWIETVRHCRKVASVGGRARCISL